MRTADPPNPLRLFRRADSVLVAAPFDEGSWIAVICSGRDDPVTKCKLFSDLKFAVALAAWQSPLSPPSDEAIAALQ